MMFIAELWKKAFEWIWQQRRWPLLLPPALIYAAIEFARNYYGLTFRETLDHFWFRIFSGAVLLLSGILYAVVPHIKIKSGQLSLPYPAFERKRRLWISSPIAVAGIILVVSGMMTGLRPPPSIPEPPNNRLVVAVAKFTPIGDTSNQADSLQSALWEQLLAKKEKDDAPLDEPKLLTTEIKGSTQSERNQFAMELGKSREGNSHIIIWGTIRKKINKNIDGGDVLLVVPSVAFVRPLQGVRLNEKEVTGGYFNSEPKSIDIDENEFAKSIADIITFVYGLACYKAGNWEGAIEALKESHIKEASFYTGLCLYERGKRSSDPNDLQNDLQDAIKAYEAFLYPLPVSFNVSEQEVDELTYAARFNRAVAMVTLALASECQGCLEEAKNSFELAVTTHPKDIKDEDWRQEQAKAHSNLGNVLTELAIHNGGDKELFKKAESAYNNALHLYPKGSLEWARTQQNLGTALAELGRVDGDEGSKDLERALEAYKAACTAFPYVTAFISKERREYLAIAKANMADALTQLGIREGTQGKARLQEAVEACRLALSLYWEKNLYWADAKTNLAGALYHLSKFIPGEEGNTFLREAEEACQDALSVYSDADPARVIAQQIRDDSSSELNKRAGGQEGNGLHQ